MSDDSHPYVDNVSMDAEGKHLTLRVEVTDLKDTKGGIEVSGVATQVGGAFATFSKVVGIDTAVPEKDADGNTYLFVFVTGETVPPHLFDKEQEITVFVRVAKVWVTVLGGGGLVGETSITQWGQVNGSSQLDGKSWDDWRAEQTQAAQGQAGQGQPAQGQPAQGQAVQGLTH